MAQIARAYANRNDGTAAAGATVYAYVHGSGTPTATTTVDANGMWEFTTLSPNQYDIKIVDGSQVRWVKADVAVQFSIIYGLDGVTAPLGDASITASMLQSTVIPDYSVAADTSVMASSNTNTIKQWFGSILTLLGDISGETHWYDIPGTSLKTIVTNFTNHTHNGTDSKAAAIPYQDVALSVNTAFSNTAWTDLCSLTLTKGGKYLLLAPTLLYNSAGSNNFSDAEARIWDGTTTYGTASCRIEGVSFANVTAVAHVDLSAAAADVVMKLSVREHTATSGTMEAEATSAIDTLAATATRLIALRVA